MSRYTEFLQRYIVVINTLISFFLALFVYYVCYFNVPSFFDFVFVNYGSYINNMFFIMDNYSSMSAGEAVDDLAINVSSSSILNCIITLAVIHFFIKNKNTKNVVLLMIMSMFFGCIYFLYRSHGTDLYVTLFIYSICAFMPSVFLFCLSLFFVSE